MFVGSLAVGGIARAFCDITRLLDEEFHADLIQLTPTSEWRQAPALSRPPITVLDRSSLDYSAPRKVLHAARALARVVNEHRYDVVVSGGEIPGVVAALAQRKVPFIHVASLRTDWPSELAWRFRSSVGLGLGYLSASLVSYWSARKVAAVTEEAGMRLAKALRVPRSRFVTLRNPNFHLLDSPRYSRRRDVSAQTDRIFTVVAVGRLTRQKGFDLLVTAFRQVSEAYPGAHLVVVGDGQDRESLARQAEGLGIADRISFLGFRDDAAAIVGRADLYVLCSRWEGTANSMLDSAAMGTPIVAYACPAGPEELLMPSGRAPAVFRIPVLSPEGIAGAICDALKSDAERRNRAERARHYVEHLHPHVVARQWRDVIHDLLPGAGHQSASAVPASEER
jgi:glycosyltransferase involved in cell wall biosynthesis